MLVLLPLIGTASVKRKREKLIKQPQKLQKKSGTVRAM